MMFAHGILTPWGFKFLYKLDMSNLLVKVFFGTKWSIENARIFNLIGPWILSIGKTLWKFWVNFYCVQWQLLEPLFHIFALFRFKFHFSPCKSSIKVRFWNYLKVWLHYTQSKHQANSPQVVGTDDLLTNFMDSTHHYATLNVTYYNKSS